MRKAITYSTFTIALLSVIVLFVTAKTYTQLAFAVIAYPAFAFLVLKLFPRNNNNEREITIHLPVHESVETVSADETTTKSKVEIADVDRRAFLKLIGVAGVSFFLFSLFSKKAQIPFFGKMGSSDSITIKDTKGIAVDPAERQPLDGYQISEIEDNVIAYYGFINKKGEWYIMKEDTENSSFRYAKGDTGFPQGWTNRNKLKYDYFSNL